ncbi:MAG: hypothetical protein Q7R79_02455 [bacterium]|nr:hypothetical protein [bacterium]
MWHGLIGFFTGTTLGRYLATVLVIIIFLTIWPTGPGDLLDFVWRRVSLALGHMFDKGQVLFQWIAAGFALYLWSLVFDKAKPKGGGGGHS